MKRNKVFFEVLPTIKINPTTAYKVMRCKKLEGREVPRSCHVLNGRKNYCKDLFVTDEECVIKDNWL